MARRRRSFGKDKNNIAVFINNVAVEMEKQRKEQEKERLREEKRLNKERAQEERRLERAREAAEREAAREKKRQERLNKKVEAIALRLSADLEKFGLYPGKAYVKETAKKAVELSVSAAGARRYFVDDELENVERTLAEEFVYSQRIGNNIERFDEYSELIEFVASHRPQPAAVEAERYKELQYILLQKSMRHDGRLSLFQKLTASREMFKSDLEEFFELMENNDWGEIEATRSTEYTELIAKKRKYVTDIESKIRPIRLKRS